MDILCDMKRERSRISAVIITRNEEQNIGYCLQTVLWCDEIIIVDMQSTDNTLKIAQEYTAHVYKHEKILAFDKAREIGIGKATGDWILLMDADELLPKTLSDTLKNISITAKYDAVLIPFKNYLLGEWNKHTGWWPDFHCRFLRKSAAELSDKIHNYLLLKPAAKRHFLPAKEEYAINHFAYRDAAQFIEKMNRYTGIEADYFYNKKIKFRLHKICILPLKEFFSRYMWHRGYKDGIRGLFVSLLLSMYQAIIYIKLWELEKEQGEKVVYKYNNLKLNIILNYAGRKHEPTN